MDRSLLTCRRPLARPLTLLAALLLATLLCNGRVKAPQEPEFYLQARSQLAAGDTLAALASLRELTELRDDFAPGWGLLGSVLTAKASGVASDFRERQEAERALRRALELDHDNPLYLFALGRLMRKQQIYVDSRRLVNRAIELMDEGPERLPAGDKAELWFQRGLFYEDEYLDTRHLVFAPYLPVAADCPAPTFCANFEDPKGFNEYLKHTSGLSEFAEDDFERMAHAFGKALEADSTHSGAFRRLTIHFIDRGDYPAALRLARQHRDAAPESPWGYITLGLIYQLTGRDSLAEAEFDRGLELAPPDVAAHYRDVSPILPKRQAKDYESANEIARSQLEEVLWRKSDPLYLSAENELRVAHLARVAYADLMFEDPSEGLWGSETEQGVIYVRYGPPQRIWLVHRDISKELSALDVAEALAGGGIRSTSALGGGRWIFWNYGWDLPNFIFEKQLRWRHASHQLASYSKEWEEEAHEALPAAYSTSFDILGCPVQLARFRGAADSIIELDFYSEVPADELLTDADSLDLGLFLFAGVEHKEIYRRSLRVASVPRRQAVTHSVSLLDGRYSFSLEARAPSGKAAVRRGEVELEPFRDGELGISDLVLADGVAPRTRNPAGRRDFALNVNRRLEFEVDDPLALYWEVYGLTRDEGGFAHYQVTLSVSDAEGGGILAKAARALQRLLELSDEEVPELTYERVVEFSGDRVPEYMAVEFAGSEPGEYRVRVQVTDQLSGEIVLRERVFRVLPSL